MGIAGRIYDNKGTIIRLTFHSRSGALFKVNPLSIGASGFVKELESENKVINFFSSVASFDANNIIFIDDNQRQVHVLKLDLKEKIIGLTSLVLYPDGTTWEGLIGNDISLVKAMIWSPELAKKMHSESGTSPWQEPFDWISVPTATLISLDSTNLLSCARQDHSCCDPCK